MSTANDMEGPRPQTAKPAVFWRRLGSSVLLWTAIVACLFSGNPVLSDFVLLGVILALGSLGMVEFYDLVRRRGLACFARWGILGGLLLLACSFFQLSGRGGRLAYAGSASDLEAGFLILFVLGLGLRQLAAAQNPHGLTAVSTTLFGLMYVPWLLNFLQKITFYPGVDGRLYLLFFLVVTKLSDSGAYAVGSLWGRHKLIPRISPAKTWEGVAGAMAASLLASLVFACLAGKALPGMTLVHATILGLLLGITAILGDLIESLFKREAGVKDSGAWVPGIGGILDLIDSLLFNAPLMYLYLRYVLT